REAVGDDGAVGVVGVRRVERHGDAALGLGGRHRRCHRRVRGPDLDGDRHRRDAVVVDRRPRPAEQPRRADLAAHGAGGLEVDASSDRPSAGVSAGFAWSISATTPARWGALSDVPMAAVYRSVFSGAMTRGFAGSVRSSGAELASVTTPVTARAEAMNDPGAI